MTSRLSIFQAYDYYHTTAAKRDIDASEKAFYSYCMDNHNVVCDGNTADDDPIIVEASRIYCNIE